MSHTKTQREARALQRKLGCSYTEALAQVRKDHPERHTLPEGQCPSCNTTLPEHSSLCPIGQHEAERKRGI